QEAEEVARVVQRTRQFGEWLQAPVEDLIRTLELGDYAYPMARDNDSRHLVDHIWDLHPDELTPYHVRRLTSLVESTQVSAQASQHLSLYLAALEYDLDVIRDACAEAGEFLTYREHHLVSCLVHVNLADTAIIDSLIRCIEDQNRTMFGPQSVA